MNAVDPLTVVQDFIRHWGPGREKLVSAFDRYFARGILWENVGLVTTNGIEEAKAVLNNFPLAFDYFTGDVLHIAAAHDAVFTERVDYFHSADNAVIGSLRLCGIFQVADGRITGETISIPRRMSEWPPRRREHPRLRQDAGRRRAPV